MNDEDVCTCGHRRFYHGEPGVGPSACAGLNCPCSAFMLDLIFEDVKSGPLVKSGDPYTSKLAAALQTGEKVSPTRGAILLVLERYGAQTDDDLIDRLSALGFPATSSSIRTRRHELTGAGFVVEAGEGVSPYGNPALRWKLSEAGSSYVSKNRETLRAIVVKKKTGQKVPGRERR